MKLVNIKMAAFTTALVGVGLFTAASAQAEGSAEKFIDAAMRGNLAEVSMGKLAENNSSNAKVKAFGTMLRTDHSKAYRDAGVAASAKGVNIPTEPTKDQQELYFKMEKMRGAEFDKEFAKHMVKDHKDDIKMYEKEARENDGPISQYAINTLPTLRRHLAAAERLPGAR